MASTYTPLGIEIMATGENAGTWGTKTNANLNLFEQLTGGFSTLSIAGGAQTTNLTVVDGTTTGTAQYRMIEFTGTITGNQIVTIPLDIETFYFLRNSTTGSFTVQFKYVTGSGDTTTFASTDKGDKLIVASANDGTNPDIVNISLASPPGGSDKQIQFNDGGSAFGGITMGTANQVLTTDGTTASFGDAAGGSDKQIQFNDSGDLSGITMGTTGQVLTTDGTTASFGDISGGTDWQTVKTTGFTAVAGEGYFINTTSGAFTMTLPASPTIGDEVAFIDYAGTFDTNNLTIGRNSQNIQGSAADLTVSTERAANTLVYTDGTQGWLLKVK
tara:strand:- start:286 stop:1275 length:990 start_codon:yes stop_codon:yes gene_type:complete